jgi:Flp pilus assembly protein TadG
MMPMLAFVCLATIDYARVFYAWSILADCARNGALYASDSAFATSTSYTTIQQAALADASNLSPAPTIASASGVDASGNSYVEVTASYTFTTLSSYPGIPTSVALSRKLRMVVTPP